jgi:hypothetical protein
LLFCSKVGISKSFNLFDFLNDISTNLSLIIHYTIIWVKMFLDDEYVSLVPVFGQYISLDDIQPPIPASKASAALLTELYEMAFPKQCSPTSDKKVVVSALPTTYPSAAPNRPGFSLGAPLKGTNSPYSKYVVDFGRRSGRFLLIFFRWH